MRHSVLFLVCSATAFAFAHRMSVAPFLDVFMSLYGITYAQAGGLLSAFYIGYAVCLVPGGILADTVGPRVTMLAGLLVSGVSSAAFAFSPGYGSGLVFRLVLGVGIALIHPSGLKILASNSPRKDLGVAVGLRECAARAGVLISTALLPLLSARFELRLLYLVLSVLALPTMFWVTRHCPPDGRTVGAARRGCAPVPGTPLQREVLLLMGVTFFQLFAINGFMGWFPTYLQGGIGISRQQAAAVMAVNQGAMVCASFGAGCLSDAMGTRRPVIAIGTGAMAAVLLCLALGPGLPILPVSGLAGVAAAFSLGPTIAMTAEAVPAGRSGTAVAATSAAGQSASALAGWLSGWLVDRSGGFTMVWMSMLGALAIEGVLLWFTRRPGATGGG
ncbi:MAG: MFS transporter [Bacillota bacterium]